METVVLIAEALHEKRQVITKVLTSLNPEVRMLFFSDCTDAQKRVDEFKPDLIITQHRGTAPAVNGVLMAKFVRANLLPHVPIIMVGPFEPQEINSLPLCDFLPNELDENQLMESAKRKLEFNPHPPMFTDDTSLSRT